MFERTEWRIDPAEAPAPRSHRWLWALLAFWFAASFWLLVGHAQAIATMSFPDADDNMRFLQVRDWLAGQGWFDLRQYRLDPPAGADIHWSRLVDLPLAAIMLALRPLLGVARADQAAAATVPLVTLFCAMALLAAIARRTIAPSAWAWAPAILLTASPALGMMQPLRIDHHGWQIAALLATTLGLIHEDRRCGGWLAGISVAGSLAIGVEMLPYLALAGLLAAVGWVADDREDQRLRGFALGAGLGCLAALFLFSPPAARFAGGCDALSSVYALPVFIAAAGMVAASALPLASTRARLFALAAAGILAALPLLGPSRICLIDPYHAVDPVARRLWLDHVAEALPLWRQSTEVMLASLALPLIGLAGAATMLAQHHGSARAWRLIALLSLFSILLSLLQTRACVAAQAMAVPGAAALGWLGRKRLARSTSLPVRVCGSALLFLLVTGIVSRLVIAALLGVPETRAEIASDARLSACMTPDAMAGLDRLPTGTFLGLVDTTPPLLTHTHHAGVAGPYHRNGRAIADVMRAWAGSDALARAVAARHHAGYIFLCGDPAEGQLYRRRAPDAFYARLMRGAPPAWLTRVPLAGTPWRVWRIGT